MARIIFQNGDRFTAEHANAIAYPLVDGADFIGHGPKVLDDYLDDTPGQIKSNFYTFYDRLKVSHQSGLTFSYLGGAVLLADGSEVSISPSTINLPDNVTRYLFLGSDGTVQAASSLPNECFPLAKLTTASGTLSGNIIDLRDKVVDRISPSTIPVTQLIPPGASMEFSGSVLPSGWLWEDGSFYAPSLYPALFAAIGYTHGQSGSDFRVPDSRGRVSVGAGTGSGLTNRVLGQTGGLEGVILNLAQTPSHIHGINDPGHSHSVSENPHSHNLNDPGHGHSITDPGHAHVLNLPATTNDQTLGNSPATGNPNTNPDQPLLGVTANNNTGININAALTNLSVGGTKTNVSLNSATSGITINAQGGNGSHENMQPWLAKNKIIKY
ncbi:phage tail protein [Nostoc sp. UIC 10607]|uniref:phage tail protein n=1 Tax=Nostoc sp. UIC 10607 TaxID=3045935 RepID=UPI0039A07FC9